jgi:hypothetical protein
VPGLSAMDVKLDSPSSPFPEVLPGTSFLSQCQSRAERVEVNVDETAAFFQQLGSEDLLKQHGPSLVTDARDVLSSTPDAKVAGLITTSDSPDATAVRTMLANATGSPVPDGLLVGIVPRQLVENLLNARVPHHLWREEPWQSQAALPVVVSTRDGHRFGFFPIHATDTEAQ